jgi:uncharacterized protein YdeI (YjbR/CyaY-like superfamily)
MRDVSDRIAADTGPGTSGDPVFFETGAQFRDWLAEHHDTATELLVGLWKASSRKPSMTWPESVDAALCFGWIDGVRRRRDDQSYTIRFTPRRPGSIWSAVNVAKAQALVAAGLMAPAGEVAFAARRDDRTAVYPHEQGGDAVLTLTADEQARLRAVPAAWAHFEAQPGWYRRAVVHWLHSAKRVETRARRLEQLVADSAAGQQVAPFRRR